jgi:hypothetical protein
MSTAVSLVVLLLFCHSSAQAAINRDDAIKIAEAAIAENGCSDLTPLKTRVDPRASRSFAFLVKHQLKCHAVAAVPLEESSGFAWLIVFEVEHSCPECSAERHRGVLVTRDGAKLRLVKKISKLPKSWKAD